MENVIELKESAVEDQYKGAGNAFLVLENKSPTKLVYENPEAPIVSKELSDDELCQLFEDHGVDLSKGKILTGMCSCYEFCFPEVLIDNE
jgi:hypothetical protein